MTETHIHHHSSNEQAASPARKAEAPTSPGYDPQQVLSAPQTLSNQDVLAAQQQVGNQVIQRALDQSRSRQKVTNANGELAPELNAAIQKKRGGGTPLPESVRKEARKILGRNFADVKIHTDDEAHRLSRAVHARAFTIGRDIFFKRGAFAPGTQPGRETILHELTHVIQQAGSRAGGRLKLGAPDTAHEQEANRIGKQHAASVSAAGVGAVQRAGEDQELLQGAPEEEELLQGQPEGEELLQGQPEDEELLQGAPEEELVQGQPDVAGTIQRVLPEEQPPLPLPPRPVAKAPRPLPPLPVPKAPRPLPPLPVPKAPRPLPPLPVPKAARPLPPLPIPKAPPPPLPARPAPKQTGFAAELAAKAKAMKGPKQARHLEALESKRAGTVGKRVSQQYMEDQANKPVSFGQKAKGFLGKAAGLGMGFLKKQAKGLLGEYTKHFLGSNPFEKKEEEGEDAKQGAAKAGGDSGAGLIMEQYAKVLQENKDLKEKLAKYEKEA